MTRRLSSALMLVVLAALSGCNESKKLEGQVTRFKGEMDPQIQLMVRHSKFLKKKAETIAAKVDKIEAEQAQISATLASLTAAPGAAKRDILAFVDSKTDSLARFQKATLLELGTLLDERDAAIQKKLKAQDDSLKAGIAKTDEFVRFVMTNQDTVNQAFASRFDQKPWYTSILGRWEQKKPTKH
jgi:ABC-type glycerol-3-phosphate transport system substrate-binding protein